MLLPLLLACRPAIDPLPSPAEWREPDPPVAVEVVLGTGVERSGLWVRRRAADGTTVPGPDTTLQLDGEARPITLSVDGYARVGVEGVGVHLVDVEGTTGRVFVRSPTFLDRGLHTAWPAAEVPSGDLVRAGAGLIGIVAGRVDWFGAAGFRHPVLEPASPVLGIANGHVDDDGILDAVAWTSDTVFVLRGREGGLVALGRLVGRDRTVAGAALGDADGDGTLDVVIAWAGGPKPGQLDVWRGDGRLAFSASPNRYLQNTPVSVTVGPVMEDGDPAVTVVGGEGEWERFYAYAGNWSRSGPDLLLDLPQGTALHLRDTLGNGGQELLFAEGRAPGEERRIQMLDFDGGVVQRLSLDRPAHIGVQDFDGNGRDDLLVAETTGRVVWMRGAAEPGSLTTSTYVDLPGRGGPVGQDPSGAVVLASDAGWHWLDSRWDGERMRPVDAGLDSWGLVPRDGAFALLDGPPFHVVMVDPGGRDLQTWTEVDGDRSLVGRLAISPVEVDVLELVVCGSTAWLLTDSEVLHIDLADPTAPVVIGRDLVVGTHLACDNDVAVVRLGTQVLRYDAGAVPTTSSALFGGPLALQGERISTCGTPGCNVAWAPLGPGGAFVEVVGDAESLSIDGVSVPGRGIPVVADVDADGRDDLLAHHQGEITVFRNTLFGIAPPERAWTPQLLVGRLLVGGARDLSTVDGWAVVGTTGRLHRSKVDVLDVPTPSTSTGDTGSAATTATGDTGR